MDSEKLEFLKSLLEYPEETAQVEYKSAIVFDPKSEFGAKLIKHILGQSNAGGGYIVLGFRENSQGQLTPDPALTEEVSRSYETTRLSQSVDSYVSEGQRVQLHVHKVEFNGKAYPLISVQGFKESPLFCCRDFNSHDGKLLLREGAIYVRDAAAKTINVAGAQQFSTLLKLAIEQRKAEIIQQVRTFLDGSLSLIPSPSNVTGPNDTHIQNWFESESSTAVSEMKKAWPELNGYIQVEQYPVGISRNWSQKELVDAAQKAVCRNTGWPIGVVLTRPENAPKPLKDGIQAIISTNFVGNMFDYWRLQRDGKYYFLRSFMEETMPRGKNEIFFDSRIWECAEALIHCSNLYKELGVAEDTSIKITITHRGLKGRVLGVGDTRRHMHWKRKCEEHEITWNKQLSLGAVVPNIEPLIEEITGELFSLFEFWRPDANVWKGILQEFMNSRV